MKKAMIISCFDFYENRISIIETVLKEKYDVEIFTSDFDHIKKQYLVQKNQNINYVHVPTYKKNVSIRRIISHLNFSKKISKIIKKNTPDLVYIMLPPNSLAKFVYKAIYKKNIKLYVDLIDMWPESFTHKKNYFLNKWRKFRDDVLQKADHIIFECGYYEEKLEYLNLGNKRDVVYLYKDLPSNSKYKNEVKHINRNITIGYLGSINRIIDIDKICEICKGLIDRKIDVSFEIIGEGENKEKLFSQLRRLGAIVNYHGIIFDYHEKYHILSRCHYVLNIMKDYVHVGLTLKSMDYFSMGIPIINNIKGDTWQMIEKYHAGINYTNSSCIDNIIENYDSVKMSIGAINIYNQNLSKEVIRNKFNKIFRDDIGGDLNI